MARSAFTELLQTLSGQRGLVEKFVTGQTDVSESALFGRIRATFGESVSDFEAQQISRSLARSVAAGDAFTQAGPGETVPAADIPITRQLELPTGERKRFVADVAVTVDVQLGRSTVEVTKLIEVTADFTLSPEELREAALETLEDLFRERGYGTPNLTTAEVDTKWVFLTR